MGPATGSARSATTAVTAAPHPAGESADAHPVHRVWRAHLQELITAERPDVDAEAAADVLLGALQSDPVLQMFERGEGARVAAVVHELAGALIARC